MAAGTEDRRAGNPVVHKHQLAKILIHWLLFPPPKCYACIPKAQSGHRPAASLQFQRYKGTGTCRYRVAGLPGKLISVSRRPGTGITQSAGGKDHPGCIVGNAAGFHTLYAAVFNKQPVRSSLPDLNATGYDPLLQSIPDVHRLIRDRKHPISPFSFQRHAELLKERLGSFRRKTDDTAVEKLPAGRDVFENIIGEAIIAHVAPAFSGNAEFFSKLADNILDLYKNYHMKVAFFGDTAKYTEGNIPLQEYIQEVNKGFDAFIVLDQEEAVKCLTKVSDE